MPALQVKDFPSDLYEELRVCAQNEDRSMAQQTVHILRSYLKVYGTRSGNVEWVALPAQDATSFVVRPSEEPDTPQARAARHRKVIEEIRDLPKIEVPDDFPSPAEIVRQMREERDDQIVPELRDVR